MISVMQGLGRRPRHCIWLAQWKGSHPCAVPWRSIDRPKDRPTIQSINNDNGSKVTKDVHEVMLTCLSNLTYTDPKYVAEFNLGIHVTLSMT